MNKKTKDILLGIIVVLIGLAVAGHMFELWDIDFDGWWTLFIIIPCALDLGEKNKPKWGSFIGLCIGVALLLACQDLLLWEYVAKGIVPAIIILIGVRIVYRSIIGAKFTNYSDNNYAYNYTNSNSENSDSNHNYTGYNQNTDNSKFAKGDYRVNGDGIVSCTAILGGNESKVSREVIKGVTTVAVFGGIELDLREAIINEDITIKIAAVFGGIDIFVPPYVRVRSNSIPIFGGVSIEAAQILDPSSPTVTIEGACVFGGADIK